MAGLSILLISLAILFIVQRESMKAELFRVKVYSDQETEQVILWEDGDGKFYVFLPGYAKLGETQIALNTTKPIYIDGIKLTDGMLCDVFRLNTTYEMEFSTLEKKRTCHLTFVQSANVATMCIDTASGSMKYIHAEKGNEETGKIRLYTADGQLNCSGELASINGRGNATWLYQEKKPYSFKLSAEADLLNMGVAQKWILLANACDPSNMRNKIVFDFAKEEGLKYSPDSQWVDLYLNGEYAGLYLLCERNEIHPERVNVSSENGVLVSMELEERLIDQNYPYVKTNAGQTLRIHDPKSVDESTKQEITEVFQSIENAILAEYGIDRISGKHWSELIDLDSWARKYLVEEIFASNDACFISQYFYYDDNEKKVYAGPVWDFDISSGNLYHWEFEEPEAFYANREYVRDDQYTPWFYMLYQNEEFFNRMVEIYEIDFLPVLKELTEEKIADSMQLLVRAGRNNQIRWNLGSSSETEANNIVAFLKKRVRFLTDVWLEDKQYYQVHALPKNGTFHIYRAVAPGECLTTLPTLEDTDYQTFLGWYYADTDEPFDSTRPITEDTEIYAKWADSSYKKKGQILKLMPLAVIACMGVCVLWADIRRMRKGG